MTEDRQTTIPVMKSIQAEVHEMRRNFESLGVKPSISIADTVKIMLNVIKKLIDRYAVTDNELRECVKEALGLHHRNSRFDGCPSGLM